MRKGSLSSRTCGTEHRARRPAESFLQGQECESPIHTGQDRKEVAGTLLQLQESPGSCSALCLLVFLPTGTHKHPGLTQDGQAQLRPQPLSLSGQRLWHDPWSGWRPQPPTATLSPQRVLLGLHPDSPQEPPTPGTTMGGGVHVSPTTPCTPPFLQSRTPGLWIIELPHIITKTNVTSHLLPSKMSRGACSPPWKPGEREEMPSKEAPTSTP